MAGAVSSTEKQDVDGALEQFGFRTESEGIRVIALLFARVDAMRELVRQHITLAA